MDFREKYKERNRLRLVELAANDNMEDFEELPESDFFKVERVRKIPSCLDLRLADGSFEAVPYSLVSQISFEPSEGIEISLATEKKVLITGRNLHLIYEYLSAFRVRFIQANIGNDIADEDDLFVDAIEIENV
jgi:hypothetical protein